MVKGNFDAELAYGHMKRAKKGGRSPWQLLEDFDRGDRRAGALFRAFAGAFKGARQVTWSHGLRDHFGVDERSDEAIAAEAVGEVIGRVPAKVFSRIMFKGLGAAVLDCAEDGGWPAVRAMLRVLGLDWGDPYDRPPFSEADWRMWLDAQARFAGRD